MYDLQKSYILVKVKEDNRLACVPSDVAANYRVGQRIEFGVTYARHQRKVNSILNLFKSLKKTGKVATAFAIDYRLI